MSGLPPDDNADLINIVEQLVKQKTKELIKTMDMCQCEKCYINACAIALNSFRPQYVTTRKGALLSSIPATGYRFQTDLTVEIVKALMIVKESPHH